jgi:hypothetical protein
MRALQWGVPVVSYDWLVESFVAGRVLPKELYKTDSLRRVKLELPELATKLPAASAAAAAAPSGAGSLQLRHKPPHASGALPAAPPQQEQLAPRSAAGSSLPQPRRSPAAGAVLAESSNRLSMLQLLQQLQGKPASPLAASPPARALRGLSITTSASPAQPSPSTPSAESTCSSGSATPSSFSRPSCGALERALEAAGQQQGQEGGQQGELHAGGWERSAAAAAAAAAAAGAGALALWQRPAAGLQG